MAGMSRLFDAAHRNDTTALTTLLDAGEALTSSDSTRCAT